MISPFLTTNIFLINLAVFLLTTSITGGIVTLVWLLVGKLLEKAGFVNIVFELMKLAAFFFCCPVAYAFLKLFENQIGSGYLFSPTSVIVTCAGIFLLLWGIGTVSLLVYMFHDNRALDKLYRDAFPCERQIQNIYVRTAEKVGLLDTERKLPELEQSYHAGVPFVKGIIKPKIILPVKEYSAEELEVIFTHELTHYKQGDVVLKGILMLLLAVHFYNPFSWLLFSKVQMWSEYACDYRTCEKAGGMKHYFEVILNMSVRETVSSRLSSQLVENQHELVGRVKRMKKIYEKKRSKWSVGIILCAAFLVSTMSVSAATLGTAELYCEWNKATVVEVENDTEMTDYEVFTETGDAEGIVTVQGDVTENARSTKPINWTVNNNVKMVGPYFECEKDENVFLNITVSPSSVTVKVGIENESGEKTYVTGSGKIVDFFEISETGRYRFFVENTSGQTVTVSGSYLTP